MTVRICNMTFPDWVSLPFRNRWTDTFIFHVDSQSCIPPFEFAPLLKRMAAHTFSKRSSASLWVQVDGPGEWYSAELRRSLKGLDIPFSVTRAGTELDYMGFSYPPPLLYSQSEPPPEIMQEPPSVSDEEMRCLQVLGRMVKGDEHEVASLAGLSIGLTKNLLAQA